VPSPKSTTTVAASTARGPVGDFPGSRQDPGTIGEHSGKQVKQSIVGRGGGEKAALLLRGSS